jgi:hypothetical protein
MCFSKTTGVFWNLAGLSYCTNHRVRIWRLLISPFGPTKDGLRGQHFRIYDAVVRAMKQLATSAGADFYERGMQTLVHRCRKYIANGDDFVEK